MQRDVNQPESLATATMPETRGGTPVGLYALFFLSGISGLMYEVVWVRVLTRILGSTVYATSTALAAFMAGLALGSFLISRFIDRMRRPLLWYMALELGIGLSALLSLSLPDHLAPLYRSIYTLAGGSRSFLTAGQVAISLVVLLLPTTLMGATLPTLSSFGARRQESFGRFVGLLYALNTAGAVAGVLLSGFVLIGAVGETTTLLIGVAINIAVAIGALALGASGGFSESTASDPREEESVGAGATYSANIRKLVVACFATGGFASLAYEVVWGRMLVIYQGTSIYAFSSMLAVILTGMALGSYLAGRRVDRWRNPLGVLAALELCLALVGALAIYLYPLPQDLLGDNNYMSKRTVVAGMFLVPGLLIGPTGFLWGMIFPVVVRCYTRSRSEAGKSIGALYAWNTLGCIAGSLVGGFVMIPTLGASHSSVALVGVSLALGVALLLVDPFPSRWVSKILGWACAAAVIGLMIFAGDPYFRLIRNRAARDVAGNMTIFRHVDEAAGTTTAFGGEGGWDDKRLWVNGVGMTRLCSLTKLLAHLPIWMADDPKDALVICLGMGTSLRSAARHPDLDVTVVELIPAIYDCIGFFHDDGREILKRPNVHPVVDDGRNYLLMNDKKYDAITIDPAPPLYSAGTVNLHTKEFFELCRSRLKPGGKLCLWLPSYGRSELPMILKSYVDVFEYVRAYESDPDGSGGFVLIGSLKPFDDVDGRIRRGFQDKSVNTDLVEFDDVYSTPEKVQALYLGDREGLRTFAGDLPEITDDRPYLEFPFWRMLFHMNEFYGSCTPKDYRAKMGVPAAKIGSRPGPVGLR